MSRGRDWSLNQPIRWDPSSGSRTEANVNWPCSTTCFVWHISRESCRQLFGSVDYSSIEGGPRLPNYCWKACPNNNSPVLNYLEYCSVTCSSQSSYCEGESWGSKNSGGWLPRSRSDPSSSNKGTYITLEPQIMYLGKLPKHAWVRAHVIHLEPINTSVSSPKSHPYLWQDPGR